MREVYNPEKLSTVIVVNPTSMPLSRGNGRKSVHPMWKVFPDNWMRCVPYSCICRSGGDPHSSPAPGSWCWRDCHPKAGPSVCSAPSPYTCLLTQP